MKENFNEVGCRNCGEGGDWQIFTNGEGDFKAVHKCGHVSDFKIVDKPDPKAIPMRLLT